MKKKLIAFLLCVLMLSAILPTGILAAPLPEIGNIKLSTDGVLSWDAFEGTYEYAVTVGGSIGYTTRTSMALKEICITNGMDSGTYSVQIMALYGGDAISSNTDAGLKYTYTAPYPKLKAPANPRFDGTTARWDAVQDAEYYVCTWYKNGVAVKLYKSDDCFNKNLPDPVNGAIYRFSVTAVNHSGHPDSDPAMSPEMVYSTASGPIASVSVTGLTEPVVGASTVINPKEITVRTVPANACAVTDAYWYNETKGTKDDTVFMPGCAYYLRVTLKPAYNCSFPSAGNVSPSYTGTANFDGKDAQKAFKYRHTDSDLIVYSPIFFLSDLRITDVSIGIAALPVSGGSMDTSSIQITTLPLNSCTVDELYWYNADSGAKDGKQFVGGGRYYLVAEITAKEGYFFESPNSAPGRYNGTVNVSGFRPDVQDFSDYGKHLTVHSRVYETQCTHPYSYTEGQKAPTCYEEGYSGDVYCADCGALLSGGQTLEKTAHTESDWITDKAAAPGVEGSKHKECTVCHTVLKTETIPALKAECAHTNTELSGAKAATCMEEGYTGDTVCKDCGKTITAGMNLPTLGHDFEDGVCTRCGAIDPDYNPAETEPTGTEPAGTEPAGTEPTETKPAGTEPTETKPAETEPTETKPTETDPTGTEPAVTGPDDTKVPGAKPSEDKKLKTVLLWTGIPAAALVGGGAAFALMKRKKK